jgi:crossover junction endodeoxyribonuclease RusA
VNHYWGTRGKSRFIGAKGKAFRAEVLARWYEARLQGFGRSRLSVSILLHPGDRRRRDIDNTAKAILDALAHARVFEDDEQIDELNTKRGAQLKGGACVVTLREAG